MPDLPGIAENELRGVDLNPRNAQTSPPRALGGKNKSSVAKPRRHRRRAREQLPRGPIRAPPEQHDLPQDPGDGDAAREKPGRNPRSTGGGGGGAGAEAEME